MNIVEKFLWVLTCAVLSLGVPDAQAETRTWVRSDGKGVSAELVGVSGGMVSLKLENGRVLASKSLISASMIKKFIKQWQLKEAEANKGEH